MAGKGTGTGQPQPLAPGRCSASSWYESANRLNSPDAVQAQSACSIASGTGVSTGWHDLCAGRVPLVTARCWTSPEIFEFSLTLLAYLTCTAQHCPHNPGSHRLPLTCWVAPRGMHFHFADAWHHGVPRLPPAHRGCEPAVTVNRATPSWLSAKRRYRNGVQVGQVDALLQHFSHEPATLPCIWGGNCASAWIRLTPAGYVAQCGCVGDQLRDYPAATFSSATASRNC